MTICYPAIMATFATENDIAHRYDLDGMTTGFAFIAGGGFATWANVLAYATGEGFFTGWFPKKYYTPAQATILAGLTFTLGGHAMDGVEYMMRVEGMTTGDFTPSGSVHSPGEAPCDILQELSNSGYVSGTIETAIDSEPALSDTDCNDGRKYETCCIEPWTDLISTVVPAVLEANWTVNAAISFSHVFPCDTKIFVSIYGNWVLATKAIRVKVDGVVVATYDTTGFGQTQNDYCYFTEFTLVGSAVARAFTFEYKNPTGSAVNDSHVYMIAYHKT